MPSSTLIAFNYPKSLIKSYQYWHLLLRPGQTTIGSLVLVCKEDVSRYSDISRDAAVEHHKIVQHIEHVLQHRFANDKINHIMLMMVDPAVHFHIIPRYQNAVTFCGNKFYDHSWPAPPDLTHAIEINDTFRDPDPKQFVERFEIESREVFAKRKEIVTAMPAISTRSSGRIR